jgi:hypothetical protein
MLLRRSWLIAVVVAFAVILAGQPALAKGPIKEPAPADPITFDAGLVCSFPVTLEPVTNRQSIKIFENGRVMINGAFRTRVTNETTGASIVIGNSGPATITENEDGTITLKVRGRSLFFFFPGDLGPGRPGALLYMTGLVVEVAAADFSTIISFSHPHGTTQNLCETLG